MTSNEEKELSKLEKLIEKMRFKQYIFYIQIVIVLLGVLLTVVAVLRVML